jgi:hypothetical protein
VQTTTHDNARRSESYVFDRGHLVYTEANKPIAVHPIVDIALRTLYSLILTVRAQMDRDLYKANMQKTLKAYPNLDLIEASVQDLLLEEPSNLILDSSSTRSKSHIRGVATEHNGVTGELTAHAVVITTGSFLRGGA